ncbi:LPXTG cell wall anchor domain-containing protein [Enterococcus faecalis]|uniref:LPXTG cell wall anchor domain-containing protein n=1 Tax=Enterococcus faecalis TaxID=1351 RepID=A0AAP6RHR0_ENTFL|nr:LPXTG cell wall anchor domain-containing protein [Enterococcus faecalis]MXS29378.1 LPXTG cell wall anchor domain-containing protein [Enterococcus faecalis]MXS52585.1 LPXTG cell wall anchor domain-containing protein [Enterococcus faecalis]
MKNTRIARLKQSKRVKQATKLLTVGLLVCPLVIGTIKALADEAETTPPVEQVAETPATAEETTPVEEPETCEPVQPEVIEEAQPVIEQPPVAENFQEAKTSTPLADTVAETVNYTIKCVDENGFAIDDTSDVTKTAKKGDSVTETAPEIENFFVLGDTSQTQTIGDNTVFTFTYRRLMATGLFHDVIGDTTAKVGESKTYQYNEVMYFNNGTMTETVIDIASYHIPLTSSDPSDVIVGGTVTFGSEGTRTLVAQNNSGEPLEVTVTKDDVNPPTTIDIELNVIGASSAKIGESKTYQLEKIEYFSDGTKKTTILDFPNEYGALISSDSSDVIKDGTITFGEAGTRTLKSESYGEASFTVTVTEDNANVDTTKLENSIKDAEAKLTAGGYTAQSTKALQEALQNAKDVLANINSTQAEIDEAQKALDLAIANLVEEDNSNGGNTGNNGSNGTGNSSNDPNTSNNGTSSTNNQANNNQNSNTTTTKPTGNNTNKDGLPQTGEQSATNAVIAGLSLTILSILTWLKRKKV